MTPTRQPELDKLPPHDEAAERGVLGCCLGGSQADVAATGEMITRVQARFGSDKVFFLLTHETVWQAIQFVKEKNGGADILSVQAELKARGQLEQLGGIGWLSELQDAAYTLLNLDVWLAILWEKFLARELIRRNSATTAIVEENGELTESHVANIQLQHARWLRLLERGNVTPKNLSEPNQFGDEYYNQFFNRQEDTYGFELPFSFPLRFRPAATTLMTGDNGSGKSSMLCLMSLVVARQLQPGEKVVVASMEMPPEVTLWIMARQLMGLGKLECTEENIAKITRALAWLNQRVLLYNFLGITDKRDLMNTFQYAATEKAGKFFIIDNMMKVGIADDDYAEQGYFIQQVCDFDLKHKAHTIVVVHENKGDGSTKQKVRGTKQLTDAVDNVCSMKRNEQKAEKLEELKAELKAGTLKQDAYDEQLRKQKNVWDSKFLLSKQRWPGSQQNASKWLYFQHETLQFHEEPNQAAIDFTLKAAA